MESDIICLSSKKKQNQQMSSSTSWNQNLLLWYSDTKKSMSADPKHKSNYPHTFRELTLCSCTAAGDSFQLCSCRSVYLPECGLTIVMGMNGCEALSLTSSGLINGTSQNTLRTPGQTCRLHSFRVEWTVWRVWGSGAWVCVSVCTYTHCKETHQPLSVGMLTLLLSQNAAIMRPYPFEHGV